MTAAIPDGLEPVATWDARDGDWEFSFGALRVQQGQWAKRHLGDPRVIRRVESYLIDGKPCAIVHRYAVNAQGRKYALGEQSFISHVEPATDPPVIVPLAELPPAHLLRTA